jgi:hypothetical protein
MTVGKSAADRIAHETAHFSGVKSGYFGIGGNSLLYQVNKLWFYRPATFESCPLRPHLIPSGAVGHADAGTAQHADGIVVRLLGPRSALFKK